MHVSRCASAIGLHLHHSNITIFFPTYMNFFFSSPSGQVLAGACVHEKHIQHRVTMTRMVAPVSCISTVLQRSMLRHRRLSYPSTKRAHLITMCPLDNDEIEILVLS